MLPVDSGFAGSRESGRSLRRTKGRLTPGACESAASTSADDGSGFVGRTGGVGRGPACQPAREGRPARRRELVRNRNFSPRHRDSFPFILFYSILNFRFPNQIQIPLLNLNSSSAKSNTHVFVISPVYYIIIHFLCHLFMEK